MAPPPAALMPHVRPYSSAPVRVARARNNCWPSSVRLTHSDAYVLKWQLSGPPALWPAMRVREVRGPQPLVRLCAFTSAHGQPLWQLRPRMRFNYAVFIDLTQFQNRLVLLLASEWPYLGNLSSSSQHLILTLFRAPTSAPSSIMRSIIAVLLSFVAYINGVMPVF